MVQASNVASSFRGRTASAVISLSLCLSLSLPLSLSLSLSLSLPLSMPLSRALSLSLSASRSLSLSLSLFPSRLHVCVCVLIACYYVSILCITFTAVPLSAFFSSRLQTNAGVNHIAWWLQRTARHWRCVKGILGQYIERHTKHRAHDSSQGVMHWRRVNGES